jgi:hypothetical protein
MGIGGKMYYRIQSQLRDLTIFYAQNQHFLKIHNTDKKNSRPNFFYLIKL